MTGFVDTPQPMSMARSFGSSAGTYSRSVAPILVLGWVAFLLWATRSALWAHLAHFRTSYSDLAPVLLPFTAGLAGASVLYSWVIRRRIWRYEPVLLLATAALPALVLRPVASLVVAAILAASFSVGSFLLSALDLKPQRGLAKLAFATILGLGSFSVALFFIGLAHLYSPLLLSALVALPILLGSRHLKSAFEDADLAYEEWRRRQELSRPWVGVCVFFSFVLLGSVMASALTPAIAYDAVHFHLPLIKTYALAGGLIEYPQLMGGYGYNPQNFEVLMTVAQALAGTSAAQLLAAAFLPLALLSAVAISRTCGFPTASIVLGVSAVLCMPMILWSAAVIKNDLAMGCFQLASIYACLQSQRESKLGWLGLSAALLGVSFGVKPVAVFAAVPIGLTWVYVCSKRPDRLRSLILVGACFAFTASLWPARTFALKGTPYYPVAAGHALDALDTFRPGESENGPRRYIDIPVRAIVSAYSRNLFELPIESPIGLTTAMFAGAVLFWLRRKPNSLARQLRFIVYVSLFYWMSTMRTLRYGITPILLLPFLFAVPFSKAFRLLHPSGKLALTAAIVYGFVFSLAATLIISNSRPQLLNLAGQLSDEDYIALSFRSYPAIRALNGLASRNDEILLAGDCLAGYAAFPWKVACCNTVPSECSTEQVQDRLAHGSYNYAVLPKSMDASVLGHGWMLAVAPPNSDSVIYAFVDPEGSSAESQ